MQYLSRNIASSYATIEIKGSMKQFLKETVPTNETVNCGFINRYMIKAGNPNGE